MATINLKLNSGIAKGKTFWMSNVKKAQNAGLNFGISQTNLCKQISADATMLGLTQVVGWSQQGKIDTAGIIWGLCSNGNIYAIDTLGANPNFAMDTNQTQSSARGIIIDSTNQLVWTNNRYIGRAITTTLSGTTSDTTSTISLTDAASFPSSGEGFIKDGNSNCESFSWSGKSSNDLTGCSRWLRKSPSGGLPHSAGCVVYYFDEDAKDIGSANTTSTRELFVWENRTLFANGRYLGYYIAADMSDIDVDYVDMGAGYDIVDFGELPQGGASYVLVGANKDENAKIGVYNGVDTAFLKYIPVNENITCMCDDLVATDSGLYYCDGYKLTSVWKLPDMEENIRNGTNALITDIKQKGKYIYLTTSASGVNRNRSGLWIIERETGEAFYVFDAQHSSYGNNYYSVFLSSEKLVLTSSNYNGGSIDLLSETPSTRGEVVQIEYDSQTSKYLTLKNIRLNILPEFGRYYNNTNQQFTIIARTYDYSKPFTQYSELTAGTPSGASQLIIVNSLGVPDLGDTIELAGRTASTQVDSAGAIRKVTGVTAVGSTYKIDVDEAFPTAIDATTQSSPLKVFIRPLKEFSRKTIDSESMSQLYMDLKGTNQPRFRGKIFLELEVRYSNTSIAQVIDNVELEVDVV